MKFVGDIKYENKMGKKKTCFEVQMEWIKGTTTSCGEKMK